VTSIEEIEDGEIAVNSYQRYLDSSEDDDSIDICWATAASREALEKMSPYFHIGAKFPDDGDDGFNTCW
jgi:hypothetical protein